jgi:hypothetical protein
MWATQMGTNYKPPDRQIDINLQSIPLTSLSPEPFKEQLIVHNVKIEAGLSTVLFVIVGFLLAMIAGKQASLLLFPVARFHVILPGLTTILYMEQ